ncbi:hypothetical protein EMIT0194MI4_20037 [Pseudomonas sp. IT-194MI4]
MLMTGMLSSCGALFQICAGKLFSLMETGLIGATSLFCLALSRAQCLREQAWQTREGG